MSTGAAGLVPLWEHETIAVGRDAHVLFVCFAKGALRDDVKMQIDVFGVSSVASIRSVDVREHSRATNVEWFDNWRKDALRTLAERDLRGDLFALDAADRCFTFEVGVHDPSDLAHLQSIWALTRWFFVRGASVALDAHAMRWIAPTGTPDPRAPFDVKSNVSMIFETDATQPSGGHVLHTRGMRKFGRPDIVAVCSPDNAGFIAEVIWQIAAGMAVGFYPGLPRHGVDISPDESWYLTADEGDAFSTRLGLNNDARLLVDKDGKPLLSRS